MLELLNLPDILLYFKRVEKRSCLTCTNFATCKILKPMMDENGDVSVQVLDIFGSDCTKYFNPER